MENEKNNNQDQNQNDQQQNNNKVEKAFENAFQSMLGILGKDSFKKDKIPNDAIGTIVEEMLADKNKKFAEDFKVKAQSIIEKKLAFDKECREAEETKNKLILEKKKAFTSEIKGLLQMVEDSEAMRKEYVATLNTAKQELVAENKEEQSVSTSQ